MNTIQLQKTAYLGWPNCYQLSNGRIDLIMTTDIGPRLIHFGFSGEENELCTLPGDVGQIGGDTWRLYGGHRLWHAPEERPRTYYPDNGTVTLEEHGGFVRLIQDVESTSGIQKGIDVQMVADEAQVTLTHRLHNRGVWPLELAPWALTVMAPNSIAILPQPPRGSHRDHLLPSHTITLWPYSDMSDPRWVWGERYILLRQDPAQSRPQKVGLVASDGWIAGARAGHLLVKRFHHQPGACYPDLGSVIESYTDHRILELESFGPLVTLQPGTAVEHIESWHLFRNVPEPANDADVTQHIAPLIPS